MVNPPEEAGSPGQSGVPSPIREAYRTSRGLMVLGTLEQFSQSEHRQAFQHEAQLILTSPPFPLNRKKAYGNLTGQEYADWLAGFAPLFRELLAEDGSIVVEMGNAWEKGRPTMSTLPHRALLAFLDAGGFRLCQEFICYNKARLPSPAQWVNVERIRVKDSFTRIWWMSPSDRPKADNRQVLKEYSKSMMSLLATETYNAGRRPSEHSIGSRSFLRNNKGAIPSNVFVFANTSATDPYQRYCRERGIRPHPARMTYSLAEFFIKFLTDPGNLVLDPFAGSNTTGAASESLQRRWLSVEPSQEYVAGSRGRFSIDCLEA